MTPGGRDAGVLAQAGADALPGPGNALQLGMTRR
jgi:hypothetical protein